MTPATFRKHCGFSYLSRRERILGANSTFFQILEFRCTPLNASIARSFLATLAMMSHKIDMAIVFSSKRVMYPPYSSHLVNSSRSN